MALCRGALRSDTGRWTRRLVCLLLLAALAACRPGGLSPAPTGAPASSTPPPGTATRPATNPSPIDTALPAAGTPLPTPTEETLTTTPDEITPAPLHDLPQVAQARADLAARTGIPPADITVVEVEAVTWPDTSMGCPAPGMAYQDVPQDGLRIRLQAGGTIYDYHSGGMREPFLCQGQGAPSPKSTPIDLQDYLTRRADADD